MLAKPEPLARTRRRKKRVESTVAMKVRAACVVRDGYCRLWLDDPCLCRLWWAHAGRCGGDSEWAHLGEHRRFKTRGMAPARRHTTATSLQLCGTHHLAYDLHRLDIQPASSRGADGPLAFTVGSAVYVEPER